MQKLRIKSGPFHRIGDQYKHMMGSDHFMGRDAFADSWIAPSKIKVINGDNYDKINIALPGFSKEEISVLVDGARLSIKAKKKVAPMNYIRHEFNANPLRTSYQLPKNIDRDKISSSFEQGILTIKLPYRTPRVKHAVEIT